MAGQRRRRCPAINTILLQRIGLAGSLHMYNYGTDAGGYALMPGVYTGCICRYSTGKITMASYPVNTKQLYKIYTMLDQRKSGSLAVIMPDSAKGAGYILI